MRNAIQYLQMAGVQGMQRSAYTEAIGYLARGLELLRSLPDNSERMSQELELQLTTAKAVSVSKGVSSLVTAQSLLRARELATRLNDNPALFAVLLGLQWHYIVRVELRNARELGEQLMGLAALAAETPMLMAAAHADFQWRYC